jgi:zinc protease
MSFYYENRFNVIKKMLPTVTLTETNNLIKDYVKEENRVVVLTGPEKEGLAQVTEAEVLKALNVSEDAIEAYKETEMAKSLLRNEVKSGSVVKKESNSKIGTTTLTLSNGAKVTYKKTDFKNDEILMEAVSFGGSNLYSTEDSKKVQFANGGLTEAGVSGLKKNDIDKFMSGKIANATPYIGNITEGLKGSSTPKDFEYLFQMTNAYMTDLNFDKEAFESYKQKQSAFFKNLSSQPNVFFQQEFYSYLLKENPRFTGIFPDEKAWENTDYQLAYNKYKERFSNAADFEFFFVGNIDDAKIEEYAAKYIASLPSNQTKEKAIDLGYRMLKGDHKKVVNKGSDPKSNVTIMFYGDATYTADEALAMQALGEVLTIKLIEELRENESGVYGVSARGSMSKVPNGAYSFTIGFPCGPENAEKLTASALTELQKMIDNGPQEKDVIKFKEGEILDYKKDIKENRFWLSNLTKAYTNGVSAEEMLKMEEKVNALTAKNIQDVAKKYLTKDKVIGMLMPETK